MFLNSKKDRLKRSFLCSGKTYKKIVKSCRIFELTKRLNDDIIIKLSGTESAEEENIKSFLKKVLDKLKTV